MTSALVWGDSHLRACMGRPQVREQCHAKFNRCRVCLALHEPAVSAVEEQGPLSPAITKVHSLLVQCGGPSKC